SLLIHNLMFYSICCILIGQPDRAQDHPGSKQILAKLAGKNQHLRKTNISEVGSLCSVKSMGYNMYRKKIHRWTEWPRGQSEYKNNNNQSIRHISPREPDYWMSS